MAIAKLLKAEIVCGQEDDSSIVSELEKSKILHIVDIHQDLREEIVQIEERQNQDSSPEDSPLQRAKFVLDIFSRFKPVQKGLLENFFGSPPFIEEGSFRSVFQGLEIEAYEGRVRKIVEELGGVQAEMERLEELASQLAPWESLPHTLSSIRHLTTVTPFPIVASTAQLEALLEAVERAGARQELEWLEARREEKRAAVLFLVLGERAQDFDGWLKTQGIERSLFPDLEETPRQVLERVGASLGELEAKRQALEEDLRREAERMRPEVQALYDEHLNRRKNRLVRRNLFFTRNVLVARGWILARDRSRLEELLKNRLGFCELRFSPPEKGENPPVRLENPRLLRPFQILLEMFGLPDYFGIDPTPFLAAAMTLFYSICLGDAAYGLLQILLCLWLKRKFKPAEGTRLFLDLMIELGAGTLVFGILTWSFFGASPGYAPGGPKILGFLPLFVPAKDILLIIAVAVGIGTVFQLASILLGFYACLKRGDLQDAFLDYGVWFLLLLSLILWLASRFLAALPPWFGSFSLVLAALFAAMVVMVSGRESKSFLARILTGVISLYGIVGYYGIVSFFSDVLSYLRIAVLNLSSSFISLVANIIGRLLFNGNSLLASVLTLIIAAIPVVVLHLLNLILSMMGSFVHSLRLNYLESFGRYYRPGGKAFAPFKREAQYHRFEQ